MTMRQIRSRTIHTTQQGSQTSKSLEGATAQEKLLAKLMGEHMNERKGKGDCERIEGLFLISA